MFKKGTKIYSIINNKCPKCNEGNFFEDNNPLHLKKVMKMGTNCTNCRFKYAIEPSFFYGAMYVSYGVSVAYLISVFVAMLVLYPSFNVNQYLAIAIGSLVFLGPYIFKLCRAIYINFFVNYDPKAIDDFDKTANM